MSFRSPLGRVLGMGAAKAGPGHWWAQRLTALALAPLGLWFVFSVVGLDHGQHELIKAWIADPAHAVCLILLLVSLIYHSYLGLQTVLEDYVHGLPKVASLIAVQFLHISMLVGGVYSVLAISFGAAQ